mgnify:CR=1 FL=1
MKSFLSLLATASIVGAGTLLGSAPASAQQTIKIGVPTSVQLQVGRDTQNAIKMAIEDINSKGGLVGRKLEMVVADETENPEQGIAAIKKLTADDKVDVLIGGYTSGVTLAQLPHIANAKTIYLGVGAANAEDLKRGRDGGMLARNHGEGEGRLRKLQVYLPRLPDPRRPSGPRAG